MCVAQGATWHQLFLKSDHRINHWPNLWWLSNLELLQSVVSVGDSVVIIIVDLSVTGQS